jgi:hypothetical protein
MDKYRSFTGGPVRRRDYLGWIIYKYFKQPSVRSQRAHSVCLEQVIFQVRPNTEKNALKRGGEGSRYFRICASVRFLSGSKD